jgi:outer membrane protein assembly factor BamE (lipoprotein component of BamABCDE complex)
MLMLALAVGACSATFRNHGYVPEPEALSAIVVGVDTQATVESTIGRPATGGVIRDDAWYYVRSRVRNFGPMPPQTVERELVAISFQGEAGTVASIERFGLERGRVVNLSRRVTETSIADAGLVRQLLRNFGRINIGEALADG